MVSLRKTGLPVLEFRSSRGQVPSIYGNRKYNHRKDGWCCTLTCSKWSLTYSSFSAQYSPLSAANRCSPGPCAFWKPASTDTSMRDARSRLLMSFIKNSSHTMSARSRDTRVCYSFVACARSDRLGDPKEGDKTLSIGLAGSLSLKTRILQKRRTPSNQGRASFITWSARDSPTNQF